MFLWFMVLSSNHRKMFHIEIDFLPIQYTPIIVWIVMFGYLFFPHFKVLNGRGRLFVINLWKRILLFCIYPCDFPASWMTDQWVSFVHPFQDFYYTCCYYNQLWYNPVNTTNMYCVSYVHADIQLIIPTIPYLMRAI